MARASRTRSVSLSLSLSVGVGFCNLKSCVPLSSLEVGVFGSSGGLEIVLRAPMAGAFGLGSFCWGDMLLDCSRDVEGGGGGECSC